ncbi:hypothetical protein V1478_010648 [Vespula squamosa]|uniref:Uncharacterized protein n=1 Tax=Vespula squamosa TaxID=30214 RepID=A0ABD2AJ89_VESSQ
MTREEDEEQRTEEYLKQYLPSRHAYTQNSEHGTWNTEHRIPNTEHGTRNKEHGTQNTKHGRRNVEQLQITRSMYF